MLGNPVLERELLVTAEFAARGTHGAVDLTESEFANRPLPPPPDHTGPREAGRIRPGHAQKGPVIHGRP